MNKTSIADEIIREYPSAPPEIISAIDKKYLETIKNKDAEIERLNQILLNFKRDRFGQRSEKSKYTIPDIDQLTLFNEAEATQDAADSKSETEESSSTVQEHKRKKKRTKDELYKDIPEEERLYQLTEEELTDEAGNHYTYFGKERIRKEIDIVKRSIKVTGLYSAVYSCILAEDGIEKTLFLKAPVPPALIPHSEATASSVAYVMEQKYVEGMPLYRQAQSWQRQGLDFHRNTLANWIILGAQCLKPILTTCIEKLLKESVVHADETPVQVLKEPGRNPSSKSTMWVYSSSVRSDHPIRIFDYRDSRNGDCAKDFLFDFHGILISDGYAGYNKLTDVTRAGCWAHVRRRWHEAMPPGATIVNSKAAVGYKYCTRLFRLEKDFKELTTEQRLEMRQKQSKPLLDEYWDWLGSFIPAQGSKLAEAVQYSLNQKPYLTVFLDHGEIDISNNLAENSIRPFVIGRKNWLFCDTPRGAQSSAIVYSLVETAKANDLDPYCYLYYLLSELPSYYGNISSTQLEQFLPWSNATKTACSQIALHK